MKKLNRKFTVAPMLDWTDTHCRQFHRLLSKNAVLYTEMVSTGAILHGDRQRHLYFAPTEHPLALQVGGSEPAEMAECARIAEDWGYDEININVGCPSPRVQKGAFGACLMLEPSLIADCVHAMQKAVSIPVTVKHRIGVDNQEEEAALFGFVDTVAQAGCRTFIVHARKAWLQGLSPKENREIPPLRYELVYRLKQAFPALEIIINGGITTLEQCQLHLRHVDGVMMGREAYHNPWLLSQVDTLLYGEDAVIPDRQSVMEMYLPHVETQLAAGVALNHISRHLLGLFQGQPGARRWRRYLSEQAHLPGAGAKVLRAAMQYVVTR